MALALDRDRAVSQKRDLPDRPDAAAPLTGRGRVLAKLVAFDPQRHVGLDILDRIVAGVGIEHVDRVQAVAAVAAAIAAGEQLDLHPEIVALLPGENHAAAVAAAAAHLPRHDMRKSLHHRIGKLDAGAEAGDDRRRENRIRQRALRRDDLDRPHQAAVLRNPAMHGRIEKHRTNRQPDRTIYGALERHVDRPVGHLRRRSGQIDRHFVAALLYGYLDRQDPYGPDWDRRDSHRASQ